MKPALLIDCDVDLYISAYQCLDWMFFNGLIVTGTIIYYDDVSIIKEEAGELKVRGSLPQEIRPQSTDPYSPLLQTGSLRAYREVPGFMA